jgi:hypothetical protein
MLKTEKAFPKLLSQSWKHRINRGRQFPFTGTKWPSQTMKISPRPLFLLHQTLELALCIGAGRVLLASTNPDYLHSSSWCLHILILGLCAAARPWKPTSWSTQRTVLVRTLIPEAVWNSVVSVDRRFLHTTHFSTRWCHSVSLCGLPLLGWATVAPNLPLHNNSNYSRLGKL